MLFTLPLLYPILDSSYFPRGAAARAAFLRETVRALADAGVELLQLRAKTMPREQVLRDAETIRAVAPRGFRLILNDYVDLLAATGFDGLHLGQTDAPLEEVRDAHPHAILGLSTHSAAQIRAGDRTTADYLAIGPVFPTTSKADAEAALGLEGLRRARAETGKPLVAIGGITLRNAAEVHAAGADSIAVLSGLFAPGSDGPGQAARDFLRLLGYNNA